MTHSCPTRLSSDLAPAAPRVRRGRWWLALVFVAELAFGAWGAWKTFAPAAATARPRDQRAQVEALEQQVAPLKRSDQISRDANRDLQGKLADGEEEIAGRPADVAFYERLVGATSPPLGEWQRAGEGTRVSVRVGLGGR